MTTRRGILRRFADGVLSVPRAFGFLVRTRRTWPAVGGLFAAVSFAPVLSGPALERIVLLRERDLGMPPREAVSFFTELRCAVAAQLLAILVGGPLICVLWLITLAFPPLAVATFPLKVAVALALVVWSLLDYPLSLRGTPLRDRLTLMRRRAPEVLGFGLSIGVLFAIPLGAVLLLPAGVAAATELGSRPI